MNERKKTVCHITSVHNTYDGRIFEKECVSLANAGYKVYLVGSGNTFTQHGVEIVGCGEKPQDRKKRFLKFRYEVFRKAVMLDCDIYHIHDPELLPFAMKLKKKGKCVIFDSHEDVPRQIMDKTWIPLIVRKLVSQVYEVYEKKLAKKLDYIISATEKINNLFVTYNSKSEVVYNYPIIHKSPELDINQKERALCFAGGLFVSNGIKELIDVVSELEIRLYLAGPIEKEILEYLQEKNKGNIKYLGIITHEEVYKLYKKCLIGVVVDLPTGNNVEGLPIKMFEYMLFGLPIITSNFPLRRKIFEEYQCGILIDPYDKNGYKDAIMKLICNLNLCKKYGENGRKAVCEKYNWHQEEKKLLYIYDEL